MKSSVLFVGLMIALLGLFAFPTQAQTVQNGDFENWTNDDPDDWTIVQADYVTEDAFAISGSASCRLFGNSALNKPRLVQYFNVAAGQEVTVEVFAYDNADGYVRMNVKVYDEFGGWLQTEFSDSYTTANWQSLSANFITPSLTDNIKIEIIFYYGAGPGEQSIYLDLCTATIAIPTVPDLVNFGFENWTGGNPDDWTVVLGGDGAVAEESVIVNSGSASLAVICQPGGYSARAYQLLTARVGDTVAGSIEVMDNDDSSSRLYLVAYDADGPQIDWSFDSSVNSGTWQTLTTTLTLPPTTAYTQFRLITYPNSEGLADQTIYFDDADFWIDTYTYDVSTANSWYFFGVPCTIDVAGNRNADALFSDDLGGDSESNTWVMGRWNNTTQQYDRFGNGDGDPGTEPPDIEPGLGYFFVQDVEPGVSDPVLDITSLQQTAGSPQSNVNQTITGFSGGANGRTMFANPYYGPYDVSTTILTVNGNPSGWGQDGINANIYSWDGSQYIVELANSASLDAWEGFFIVKTTSGDGDIELVYNGDDHGPTIDGIDDFLDYGWSLDLQLESIDGVFRDDYNKLGTRGIASDGYDGWDAFEMTPPASQYVSLAFSHPDWQEGTRFAHDFRNKEGSDDSWDIEVKARHLPGETFRMYWPNIQDVPQNIELWLYEDSESGLTPVGRLRDMEDYEFTVGNTSSEIINLSIRAIDTDVATLDIGEDDSLLPTEFGIQDAYPNPFNAQITIKVGLPETGEMSLQVFDILGREVATLYSGQLRGGLHNFTWNAGNSASGIYFLRMTGDNQVTHRKITLLQ